MLKSLCAGSVIVCSLIVAAPAIAQHEDSHVSNQAPADVKTVNAMCPIGKEPIVPSAGTVEYKGKTIGLCCPSCGNEFSAWDEAQKDEFVALAIAHREPGQERHGIQHEQVVAWTAPYTLDTCIVSGGTLGSMGDPIVKMYDGREVRFCCSGCIEKFEADKIGYFKKIDEQIIADQLPYYPAQTCIVTGESLVEDGEDVGINMVYNNRLVRLCCTMCKKEFKADPAKFMEQLDKQVADAQRADYPIDTCVVGGGKLGSMGEPVEMVVGGRLVRLCCDGCIEKVNTDPVKYLSMFKEAPESQKGDAQ